MKYRYAFALVLLSGCFPDKAAVDPYSYAPRKSSVMWRVKEEPPAVPVGDVPLSLAEVLDIALRNNPNTKITWAKARVAAAQYGQTESYYFPTIYGSYAYTRSRGVSSTVSSSSTGSSLTGGSTGGGSSASAAATTSYLSQWGPQLQLSYVLFDFGQRRATSDAAKQALYFADYTHNQEIQTVLQQVTGDYYNYLYQQELLRANEADLTTAQVTFDATKLGIDTGVNDVSDLLQAQTKLLQAQVQLVTQKQNIVNSYATLVTDMGLRANQVVAFQELPDVPPTDEMLQSADSLLALAMQKRNDLLAAEANLKSQEANVSAAWRQFLPVFEYNLNFGETSYSKIGSDHYDFESSFSVSVPLFTGFYDWNNLRAARAQRDQAKASLLQTELQVVQQITTAHSQVKTSFETVKFSDELLKTTQEQYDVSLARYRAGVGNILELISAQSSLADARASQVNATNQWFTSLVDLSYAVGTLELPEQEVQ